MRTPSRLTVLISSLMLAMPASAEQVQLRIIETSDIHTHLTDFDYNKDQPNAQYGLTRTAKLIKQAQKEVKNSVYVDNGDLIQGAPIGDYIANKGLGENEKHPSYLALEKLGATASVLGNHEFNYGLDYLDKAIANTSVPVLSANVFNADTKAPRYKPYLFKIMYLKDAKGKKHRVNVAFIGFTPPQILQWDKQHLDGKILVSDIVLTAKKYVPLLKYLGADVIIALNHSGMGELSDKISQENTTLALSQVDGIDAIAFGHEHAQFPSKQYANIQGVNIEQGTINGVPATMPGQYGSHIGVIDLVLDNSSGRWQVVDKKAELRPIFNQADKKPLVSNSWRLKWAMKPYHDATREFMAQPIGESANNLYSYLALVQDDATVQLVNMAQKDFIERAIANRPDLNKLPILSATAPFKAGGRHNDPNNYVEVEQGKLSRRHASDLYVYPNTISAVKVSGAELKEWLECSAGMFRQITPQAQAQPLLNWDGFRTYNFDVIDGVNYVIDVSKPARYDGDCQLKNPNSTRIRQLTYQGKPVPPQAQFLVVTNQYRAFGGKFAGTGEKKVVYSSSAENRQVVSDFIQAQTQANGVISVRPDRNWQFAPILSTQPVKAYFESSPSEKARAFVALEGERPYQWRGVDEKGFGIYEFDFSEVK